MDYKVWKHREDSIIVQKYSGAVSKEFLLHNQSELFDNANQSHKIQIILTDISSATLSKIAYPDIGDLFKRLGDYADQAIGMKYAVVNAENRKDDFLKASAFSKFDSDKKINIKNFSDLKSAMSWLDLSLKEQLEVSSDLIEESRLVDR